MAKRDLFLPNYRVQITFQLGCEQRQTSTENYEQDMKKILRNSENVQCFIGSIYTIDG